MKRRAVATLLAVMIMLLALAVAMTEIGVNWLNGAHAYNRSGGYATRAHSSRRGSVRNVRGRATNMRNTRYNSKGKRRYASHGKRSNYGRNMKRHKSYKSQGRRGSVRNYKRSNKSANKTARW